MPSTAQLQFDGRLSNVSIQYHNEELVADRVLPRKQVNQKVGKYKKYGKDERFTVPSTLVGPKSNPNEVEWSTSEDSYECLDYGLEEFLSKQEEDNAEAPFSPQSDTTEFVTGLVELDREIRAATVVFNAANYPAANKVDINGGTDWNTLSNDAVAHIETGIDACFMRPNIAVMGLDVWRKLRRNEKILAAIKGTLREATVTQDELAKYFGLEEVIVGQSKVNSAAPGQAATYARVWNTHFALHRRVMSPGLRDVQFGITYQWGAARRAYRYPSTRGADGGQVIRVVESVVEKLVATDVGYLIQNAV